MRKFTQALLILSLLLSAAFASAQVKGLVNTTLDNGKKEPLIGATVIQQGTSRGVTTDIDGHFTINIESKSAVLQISYVGYKTKLVDVVDNSNIEVILEEDATQIEEAVVVGYGTQRKVNLSGAVDQMTAKQLQAKPIANLSQGLQGAIPNLNIDFGSGQPGAVANINIRGTTSVNGGSPLIIIDGVPAESAELNRISPSDISSISVLKDASSAAIYGARAAFGVILITTKQGSVGKSEKLVIDFTTNFAWKKASVLPNKISDPYIYARLLQTSVDNTPWGREIYNDYQLEWARQRSDDPSVEQVRMSQKDAKLYDYMGSTDWTRYYLDNFTPSNNQQLSISGSTEKASYYFSVNQSTENGAIAVANDSYKRYGVRNNVIFRPYKWLTVGNNSNYATSIQEQPSYLSIWDLYNVFPTDVDKNPDGTWANTGMGRVLARITDGGRETTRDDIFTTTFTLAAQIIPEVLKINGDYTFRRQARDYRWNYSKYKIGFGPDDIREEGTNESYRSDSKTTYKSMNLYLNFNKMWGKHTVTALLGYNEESSVYDGFSGRIDKLISSSLPSLNLATGTAKVADWYTDWAIRGIFGRLNYTFDNKYIVELNARYDGSSRFPKSSRFGLFPSVSGAWRIDRESFMDFSESVVSQLKLRASYGSLGNQSVGAYGYISSMASALATPIIGADRPLSVGSPSMVSGNYTWEKVSTTNFGIDLNLLDNKITTSFDFYTRNTEGMLVAGKALPGVLGTSAPKENAADLRTKGWELSVGYNDSFQVGGSPLNFNTRFVLSDSRSHITKFDNPTRLLSQYYVGYEMGEMWGLQSDGFFNSQAEIDALDQSAIIPWGALTITNGWPKYIDRDKNEKIEKGTTVDDPKDLAIIGNTSPRFRYGINLGADWKGFDLNVFLQGVGKRDYYPTHYLYWGFYQQPYAGGYQHLLDFYREFDDKDMSKHSQSYINSGLASANRDAKYPVLQSWLADQNGGAGYNGLVIPQTKYLLDGSYLRIKNITIGYTLPSSLTKKLTIERLRIYVSGDNIFEFSQIKNYFDPEAITNDNTGYVYPFQRTFTVGFNITF